MTVGSISKFYDSNKFRNRKFYASYSVLNESSTDYVDESAMFNVLVYICIIRSTTCPHLKKDSSTTFCSSNSK